MNNLANKLRVGTQQAHIAAEHTEFMSKFLQGAIDKNMFSKLLANLYYIYSQLEAELEHHKDHVLISSLYFEELNRKDNLQKDLAYYYGDNWQEKITPSRAVRAFLARIRVVSATKPVLLIAHAYTRYMGDLSGGQGLKKIVRSSLNLPEGQGSRFYEFSQIPDVQAFKAKYRQALNDLLIDEVLEDQIVAEANISFNLNIQMLRELEEELARAVC